MKRELCAVALLLVLLLGSLGNLAALDHLVGLVKKEVTASQLLSEKGAYEQARRLLGQAKERWDRARAYTEIVLRHPEIDAIADAFFDLKQLLEEEAPGLGPAYAKLLYHLDCVDRMEHPRLGSIL